LKQDPKSAILFYCIALVNFIHKNDVKKAQTCVEKAITLKPDFPEAEELYCLILMSSGHRLKAIAFIDKMQNKNLAFSYLFKGYHEYELGNYVVAVEHF